MNSHQLIAKPATIKDAKILFNWVNESKVRQNSFNQDKINWKEHVNWLKKSLEDKNINLYIAIDKHNNPIGMFRIDVKGKQGLVTLSLDKNYRGQELGNQIMNLIIQVAQKIHLNSLVAQVKKQNQVSVKLFINHHFKIIKSGIKNQAEYLELTRKNLISIKK